MDKKLLQNNERQQQLAFQNFQLKTEQRKNDKKARTYIPGVPMYIEKIQGKLKRNQADNAQKAQYAAFLEQTGRTGKKQAMIAMKTYYDQVQQQQRKLKRQKRATQKIPSMQNQQSQMQKAIQFGKFKLDNQISEKRYEQKTNQFMYPNLSESFQKQLEYKPFKFDNDLETSSQDKYQKQLSFKPFNLQRSPNILNNIAPNATVQGQPFVIKMDRQTPKPPPPPSLPQGNVGVNQSNARNTVMPIVGPQTLSSFGSIFNLDNLGNFGNNIYNKFSNMIGSDAIQNGQNQMMFGNNSIQNARNQMSFDNSMMSIIAHQSSNNSRQEDMRDLTQIINQVSQNQVPQNQGLQVPQNQVPQNQGLQVPQNQVPQVSRNQAPLNQVLSNQLAQNPVTQNQLPSSQTAPAQLLILNSADQISKRRQILSKNNNELQQQSQKLEKLYKKMANKESKQAEQIKKKINEIQQMRVNLYTQSTEYKKQLEIQEKRRQNQAQQRKQNEIMRKERKKKQQKQQRQMQQRILEEQRIKEQNYKREIIQKQKIKKIRQEEQQKADQEASKYYANQKNSQDSKNTMYNLFARNQKNNQRPSQFPIKQQQRKMRSSQYQKKANRFDKVIDQSAVIRLKAALGAPRKIIKIDSQFVKKEEGYKVEQIKQEQKKGEGGGGGGGDDGGDDGFGGGGGGGGGDGDDDDYEQFWENRQDQRNIEDQLENFVAQNQRDPAAQKAKKLKIILKKKFLSLKAINFEMRKFMQKIFFFPSQQWQERVDQYYGKRFSLNDLLYNAVVFKKTSIVQAIGDRQMLTKVFSDLRVWGKYFVDISQLENQIQPFFKKGNKNDRTYQMDKYDIKINVKSDKVTISYKQKNYQPQQFKQAVVKPIVIQYLKQKSTQIYFKFLKQNSLEI